VHGAIPAHRDRFALEIHMSRLLMTLTPVALAAAVAAALATLAGTGDGTSHASVRAPDAPAAAIASEPLFMSERFEEQKRNARSEELPSQF
jgi:hypothetical protein